MANRNSPVGPKKDSDHDEHHQGSERPRPQKRSPRHLQISLSFHPESKQSPLDQENQSRAVVATLPIILFVVDCKGTFTLCEGKGLEALSPSPGEYVGRSFFDLYPDSPEMHKHFEEALNGRTTRARHRFGDREFETSFIPLSGHSGKATGVVGLCVEIAGDGSVSETAEHKEPSEDSVRALQDKRIAGVPDSDKTQIFARISHELRSPLHSISGFASLVLQNKEGCLGEQELFYMNRILGNTNHLLTVLTHMLDFSAIQSGKVGLTMSEVNLDDLIPETIADLGGHARSDSLEIVSEIPKNVQPIKTDHLKLKQVLINLLANALKFTERGRVTVRVDVDEKGQPTRIDVVDTGVGVPPEKLESIFEAFERVESAVGQGTKGMGLGLAISRSLCEMMGYRIGVESEPGAGSTFTIYLSSNPHSK